MYLKINQKEINVKEGTTWQEAIAMMNREQGWLPPLGICVLGRTCSLTDPAEEYARAEILTFKDEEGRRIYERSLVMLLLTAAWHVDPAMHLRVEHSFGKGIFIRCAASPVPEETVEKIKLRMKAIADECLPYEFQRVTTSEAKAYFDRTGQTDRSRVLTERKMDSFKLYQIGDGPKDDFYGAMVPDTGCVRVFDLVPYAGGMVLMMPDPGDPYRPAEFHDYPKLFGIYEEMAHWNEILDCENVADLNDLIRENKIREFIRINEVLQEKKIASIAEKFAASGARLILIAGPSSSGKTTFANRLEVELRVLGYHPARVSLDDYYRNRSELPVEENGEVDLEKLECLDVPLINLQLQQLIDGEEVQLPIFDFKTQTRAPETRPFRVNAGEPIIIEGIHALNGRMTEGLPDNEKFRIYISALTVMNLDDHNRIRTTDARLLRRIVRDMQFRATPPEETIERWQSVRHGEDNYIFPFQENADVMFNSSLTYELIFMRKYVYTALRAIQPEQKGFTIARRLLKFLNYILPADIEDEIPVNSLLREFLGGCCFYRDSE